MSNKDDNHHNSNNTPSLFPSFVRDYTLGGASKAIGMTISAPIDRLALVLHHGDQFKMKMFWNGNLLNVIRCFLPNVKAFQFALNSSFQQFLPQFSHRNEFGKFMTVQCVSGALSVTCMNVISWPWDSLYFHKFRDASTGLTGLDRFLEMYKGIGIKLVSGMVFGAVYFGFYDSWREKNPFRNDLGFKGWISKYGMAQITSWTAAFLTLPIDYVRRRIMMQEMKKVSEYNGSIDCFRKILNNEGLKIFRMSSHRRTIGPALIMTLYDQFHVYLKQGNEQPVVP